jgi:hypothetical protein
MGGAIIGCIYAPPANRITVMGRGTPITPLRLSEELLGRIREAIDSANERRTDEPYDLTGWIRQAIEEKLKHRKRGTKKGKDFTTTPEGGMKPVEETAKEGPPAAKPFMVRVYLGSEANAEGHHVGRFASHRFATLEEAEAFRQANGGALYDPTAPRKRRKKQRKGKANEGGEGQEG